MTNRQSAAVLAFIAKRLDAEIAALSRELPPEVFEEEKTFMGTTVRTCPILKGLQTFSAELRTMSSELHGEVHYTGMP